MKVKSDTPADSIYRVHISLWRHYNVILTSLRNILRYYLSIISTV